jgi:hypothetical protein
MGNRTRNIGSTGRTEALAGSKEVLPMKSWSAAGDRLGTLVGALLMASALTPAGAADMSFERALNVGKEPQNWLLHHGNYQGHRFSQNWEPSAYNPELDLLYLPSYERCNTLFTEEQKDMADQGGPVMPRQRFAGGGNTNPTRLYGSLKAIDPATGEIKARARVEYPNLSGALATAGNLVFIGEPDGAFTAHDARTLQELWSFNMGTGINAPPVSYSVNGKQYIAVLVGSKQPNAVMPNAPELKNTSTASMLYVFGL